MKVLFLYVSFKYTRDGERRPSSLKCVYEEGGKYVYEEYIYNEFNGKLLHARAESDTIDVDEGPYSDYRDVLLDCIIFLSLSKESSLKVVS